jgi:hypothetical protein
MMLPSAAYVLLNTAKGAMVGAAKGTSMATFQAGKDQFEFDRRMKAAASGNFSGAFGDTQSVPAVIADQEHANKASSNWLNPEVLGEYLWRARAWRRARSTKANADCGELLYQGGVEIILGGTERAAAEAATAAAATAAAAESYSKRRDQTRAVKLKKSTKNNMLVLNTVANAGAGGEQEMSAGAGGQASRTGAQASGAQRDDAPGVAEEVTEWHYVEVIRFESAQQADAAHASQVYCDACERLLSAQLALRIQTQASMPYWLRWLQEPIRYANSIDAWLAHAISKLVDDDPTDISTTDISKEWVDDNVPGDDDMNRRLAAAVDSQVASASESEAAVAAAAAAAAAKAAAAKAEEAVEAVAATAAAAVEAAAKAKAERKLDPDSMKRLYHSLLTPHCTHTIPYRTRTILYSYCTHTILYSYHTVLVPYCTRTILSTHTAYSYCILILHTHTADCTERWVPLQAAALVLTGRTHCTPTGLLLHSYCTPTALLLYSYCTPTALLLYSYCTPTVLLLYSYCTPTVLILARDIIIMGGAFTVHGNIRYAI